MPSSPMVGASSLERADDLLSVLGRVPDPRDLRPGRAVRLLRPLLIGAALLALGLVIGTASVLVHGRGSGLLLLGITATTAVAWALPGGWWLRLPFGVGWVAVAGYASHPRPEGDYLVASDVPGYLLLGYGLALLVVCVVSVRPLRPVAPPETGGAGS